MNYLAHFHLAARLASERGEEGDGLLIGALLGDHVKGPLRGEYPDDWEEGIRLHRRIDALTDSHPATRDCLRAFPDDFRRYAGIALDVCFDHVLSQHWRDNWGGERHTPTLETFSQHCYQTLLSADTSLPDSARRQSRFLADYNVLCSLQDWHNTHRTLSLIARRLRRPNPLQDCAAVLAPRRAEIERCFFDLYPALIDQLSEEFKR